MNTLLRWTVYDPIGEPNDDGVHINFTGSNHEETLRVQQERLYDTEFKNTLVDVKESLSVEYQRAK